MNGALPVLAPTSVASLTPGAPQLDDRLEIIGVPHPRMYLDHDWKSLEHATVRVTNPYDRKVTVYSGVPLQALLKQSGFSFEDNFQSRAVVIASSSDGYYVDFSIGELDERFGNLEVLVADRENDRPLAPALGPLRLVVPRDRGLVRWVRAVKIIRVLVNPLMSSQA